MTNFILNGQARQAAMQPGTTVLNYLRLHERLTATKEGCAEGDCGACTVAIGRPDDAAGLEFAAVNSCIMLAADLDGRVLITAEGLADGDALAPPQQAMVEQHASQCGFCTPGFVMSLFAFSQAPPPEDKTVRRDAVLDALAGNLCRCTGYRPIVAAAEAMTMERDPRIAQWRQALDQLPRAADKLPDSLEELDALLLAAPASKLTSGVTDLGVPIAKHGEVPAAMLSLRRVAGLDEIAVQDGWLCIGATATYSKILPYLADHFPNFAALVRRLGSLQIRNAGTMGGNLCNASPIGDSAPCLIALDAVLVLRAAAGEREIAIDEFFTGYRRTALAPGEYLRTIKIPLLREDERFFAYKLAKRYDQDISSVAGAFKITALDGKITALRAGFGGMAATPMRARLLETAVIGQACEAESFTRAAAQVANAFTPLTDFRASAGYRLQAAAGFMQRLGAQLIQPGAADIWAL